MAAAFEFERAVSSLGKVSVRLSAQSDQLVLADGDTPIELRITIHSTTDPIGLKLQNLLERLRTNPTSVDYSLQFFKEQRLGPDTLLVYRLENFCACQLCNGFRPLMARLDGISKHAKEWLLQPS